MPGTLVAIEGALFPPDLLDQIAAGEVEGQSAAAFGLDSGRRLIDEIQHAFSDARVAWDAFQRRLEHSRESPTSLTRQYWAVPFFEILGFQSLQPQRAHLDVGGQRYDISHLAGEAEGAPAIHVVSVTQELDARDGRRAPHTSVQEYLNRSDTVWGIATNGERLRLLRDSERFSRPTYIEFDIRGIFEGNQYAEFALLYRLLHATRFPRSKDDVTESWLERYFHLGIDQGGRVREKLRDGVVAALRALGNGFLQHSDSEALREAVRSGQLNESDYYRQLLRLVYRLLFLMVAEERRLIFPAGADTGGQVEIYRRYYSVSALRDRCERYFAGDRNHDLWLGLVQTFRVFRDREHADPLAMAPLDGELFGEAVCHDIEGAMCTNEVLLGAVRQLSTFLDDGNAGRRGSRVRRRVNYAGLDVEEFGSVYESLLDFHPRIELEPHPGAMPDFDLVAGSERKQTGSYYTPPELVRELIESALVPVMNERLTAAKTREDKERALLGLRVLDPAAGSGHFLLAAARRIARELANVRAGEDEASPAEFREAMRDAIRHCVYAVDRNPLAVDLCKVALWIEGHRQGLPLSFLNHHVRCGDSLVGVFDLAVLAEGIPDGAYAAVTGDDRTVATNYRNRNREERSGQMRLGEAEAPAEAATKFIEEYAAIADRADRTVEEVQALEEAYKRLRSDETLYRLQQACDLWTAAFFALLRQHGSPGDPVPTTLDVRRVALGAGDYQKSTRAIAETAALSTRLRFFHWPLEFPDVLLGRGGFDVVLGNPPWEQLQPEEVAFFSGHGAPEIANLAGARRKAAIENLSETAPALVQEWQDYQRDVQCVGKFVRNSGRAPLGAVGKINTYTIFVETKRALLNSRGRAGVVIPTGIATDDTTKQLFADLVERRSLVSLLSFENEELVFPGIHHTTRFCLLTICGHGDSWAEPDFTFFIRSVIQLQDAQRHFTLTTEDFALLNPNTHTCPIFRTRRDAEITKGIYRRVPILVDDSRPHDQRAWSVAFRQGLFNMTSDSQLFHADDELQAAGCRLQGNTFVGAESHLPLYEGKMIWHFDHRFGTYEGQTQAQANQGKLPEFTDDDHAQSSRLPLPRYWVARHEIESRLIDRWDRAWFLSWRDITGTDKARTVIASIVPRTAVGHTMPLFMLQNQRPLVIACLQANLCSFVFDFIARQKVGGTHLTYSYLEQLPVIPPELYEANTSWMDCTLGEWLVPRVVELTYTAWDLEAFGSDLEYDGAPFRWDSSRRFLLRCELDAAFFHLYGVVREDVEYVLETFPIVKRNEEREHGEYRTKRVILEIYDEMARAMQSQVVYKSRLDPPPADPAIAHSSDTRPTWAMLPHRAKEPEVR